MDDIKRFTLRLERELWLFWKLEAAEQDVTMHELFIDLLQKLKKKKEKRKELTPTL